MASHDAEKTARQDWAAAYAAEALSARDFVPRDVRASHRIRDFDLIFDDGHIEPLEVTLHGDKTLIWTMNRLDEREHELKADVTRLWFVDLPRSNIVYDVRACERDLPGIVERLERAGITSFSTDDLRSSSRFHEDSHRLHALGIGYGSSFTPADPDHEPGIVLRLRMGGEGIDPRVITTAVEREASDSGNQKKLAACQDAPCRHLFVVLTLASTNSAFSTLWDILDGNTDLPLQPVLPHAITTVWAGIPRGAVFVTPPNAWEIFRPSPELRDQYTRDLEAE